MEGSYTEESGIKVIIIGRQIFGKQSISLQSAISNLPSPRVSVIGVWPD